jgi:hypothetical protein
LRDCQEAFERLARLLDAALGEITQLIGDLKRELDIFFLSAAARESACHLKPYNRVFAAVQHIWPGQEILTLKTMRDADAVAKIQRPR